MSQKKDIKNRRNDRRVITKVYKTTWQQEEFFKNCEINLEVVEKSKLSWEELANIHDNHFARIKRLDTVAKYISDRLREIPLIHSVRARVKNSKHLVNKILRKRIEDESRNISLENYNKEITDLIGIRALHLYKEDWLQIHNFIKEEWNTVEVPTAYIREGDNPEWTKLYEDNGCEVKVHPRNYRSVHYLIEISPSKMPIIAELQVRTLFEEAWSEIDHQINYPQAVPHNVVAYYLELFNRYAGSADEMGSLLRTLVTELHQRDLQSNQIVAERDDALQRVEELLTKVEMDKAEREELEKKLGTLRRTQSSQPSAMFSSPVIVGESGSAKLVRFSIAQSQQPIKMGDSTVFLSQDKLSDPLSISVNPICCTNCSRIISFGEMTIGGQCSSCGNLTLNFNK